MPGTLRVELCYSFMKYAIVLVPLLILMNTSGASASGAKDPEAHARHRERLSRSYLIPLPPPQERVTAAKSSIAPSTAIAPSQPADSLPAPHGAPTGGVHD